MSVAGSHGAAAVPVEMGCTPAMTSSGAGRSAGSLARQEAISPRSGSSIPSKSGSSEAIRNITACMPPPSLPKGVRPVAAYASTEPMQNTSLACVTGCARICSGE